MSKSGAWIKALIRDLRCKGKNQNGLAEMLGLPQPRISEIIHGKRQVQVTELLPMAAYLEVTLEELVVRLTQDSFTKPAPKRSRKAA